MKWIDTNHIRNWASRRDCQDKLPLLIRKLIRATSSNIKNISFPAGENVSIGGWDGVLEISEETTYVPLGTSVWEFGASNNPKGKADDDYNKRKADPLGFDPKETTYIFVTPRLWTKKDEWTLEKNKEGFWKEVRVYDAQDLEEWIETAPSVGAWLAINHLAIYPGGIQPADDFWEEWSTGNKIKFLPEVVLAGRKNQIDALFSQSKQPAIIPVKASSREEAIAFIIAAYKNDDQISEDFFAKALVIDSLEAFREIMVTDKSLYLIVRFEDDNIINRARNKGHVVFVPLGTDNSGQFENSINLPALEREEFLTGLIKSGLPEVEAEKFSKRSARNLSVLRRQLEFNRSIPQWANKENVREVIPALLAGRWKDDCEEDVRAIEHFANEPYSDYIAKLKKWLYAADAPIVQIGSSWRLTSPLDAWTYAGKYCTQSDLGKLEEMYLGIFSKIDPTLEIMTEDRQHLFVNKKPAYSRWIREGLIQSLIIISVYGDRIGIDLQTAPSNWIDLIIQKSLASEDPNLWKSLDNELPLIAEAAPSSFLLSIEKLLSIDNGPIHQLFNEVPGWLDSHSYHTGLLWSLEGLAWMPEYLSRVSLILSRLSEIDPGGRLSNRPINSLREIFKSWHPQSLANLTSRFESLKLMVKHHKEIGLNVIKSLLPSGRSIAHPTYRMRWRLSDEIFPNGTSYDDLYKTYNLAIELLLGQFDYSENSFNELTKKSFELTPQHREKVLDFLEGKIDQVNHTNNLTWHSLRETVGRHRTSQTADWAIPEPLLERYQKLYDRLIPNDPIEQVLWILKEQWPQFIEGKDRKATYEERAKIIHDKKMETVNFLYTNYGIDFLLDFAGNLKLPEINSFAAALSVVVSKDDELFKIWEGLKTESTMCVLAQNVADSKRRQHGNKYIFQVFQTLKEKGFTTPAVINLLLKLFADGEIWDFIETNGQEFVDEYWRRVNEFYISGTVSDFYRAINIMLNYKRNTSALKLVYQKVEDFDSELIIKVLESFIGNEVEKDVQIDDYEFQHVFDELRKKGVEDRNTLIKLEWFFLPFLDKGYNNGNTPILHQEMADHPEFFIQVLEKLYNANSEDEEGLELTEEEKVTRRHMALAAYKLLNTWATIPGVDSENNIDEAKLNDWVDRALKLASKSDRLEAAHIHIGSILAKFPEVNTKMDKDKEFNWPPDVICEIIEKINSDSLYNNFEVSTYNKRSSSSRGAFDGGAREWHIAKYFKTLSQIKSGKYPKVAAMFEKLAKDFEQQANREDQRAERDKLDY